MRTYPTDLFIEIIESNLLIKFLRSDYIDDVHLRFYQGLKGNKVTIDTSEEDISERLACAYLTQLGLDDLIPNFFPPIPAKTHKAKVEIYPIVSEKVGNKDDCQFCNGVGSVLEGENYVACSKCNGTGGTKSV